LLNYGLYLIATPSFFTMMKVETGGGDIYIEG